LLFLDEEFEFQNVDYGFKFVNVLILCAI